ncbi:MAG TPA: lysoplasmalogenase [Blastocatellia bacterium]|nr:lysoplasmalogenase [Blastocatellia bacterium]
MSAHVTGLDKDRLAPRHYTAFDRALLAVSILAGGAYLATTGLRPYAGSVVIKALAVAPLAFIAFNLARSRQGVLLGVALAFSSLGDIFLGLDRESMFVYGLGSFLVAHLFYIALFARHLSRPLAIKRWQTVAVALVVAYSGVMMAWLVADIGGLVAAVAAYMLAITVMVSVSVLANFGSRRIAAGALLFLLSDSLIAVGKFKTPVLFGAYLVWATYYAAQLMIATGYLKNRIER